MKNRQTQVGRPAHRPWQPSGGGEPRSRGFSRAIAGPSHLPHRRNRLPGAGCSRRFSTAGETCVEEGACACLPASLFPLCRSACQPTISSDYRRELAQYSHRFASLCANPSRSHPLLVEIVIDRLRESSQVGIWVSWVEWAKWQNLSARSFPKFPFTIEFSASGANRCEPKDSDRFLISGSFGCLNNERALGRIGLDCLAASSRPRETGGDCG